MSTALLRRVVLLLFVGGLLTFLLIDLERWLPSHSAEPLVIHVRATADLQAWLEDARRHFLAHRPRVAGHPLSLTIEYEEDAATGHGIADHLRARAASPSMPSTAHVWLASRTAVQLLETTTRMQLDDQAVIPLVSTMLAVTMWEARARDVLPATGAMPARSQPLNWNDLDISWMAWHRLSVNPPPSGSRARAALRWAIPDPLHSAAGLASIALMSLGDAGPQSVRWPDEPAEQKLLPWLGDFLRTIHRFRPSARDTADDFIKYGPAHADVALLPEHLALEVLAHAAEGTGPGGIVLYPRVNIAYEYVCIDLSGATPHPPQRDALKAFQRYLRSDEGQQLALAHGLRPVLPHLRPRPTDPWPRFSTQGAQYAPQVIWTDVRAIVGPASRLARQVMEQLHSH
jgi:extracellular solute-binding protein